MLVELQLTHSPEIREIVDRAWGVVHNKHRKRDTLPPPLDPSDPHSYERLITTPIGQDNNRVRYWVFDGAKTFSLFVLFVTVWLFLTVLFSSACHLPRLYPPVMTTSDTPRLYVSTNPWKVR